MEKKPFGKTGMNVAALGFGGGEIGYENAEYTTVKELLTAALDEGLNVIDTAECYVDSEEKIGETVSHRRGDFYLFTKCGHGDTYAEDRWSKKDITKSIERSLKRLKMDYVDLVQLHSCNEAILRKGEVIEALQEAKKAGKTRFIGYSGDGTDAVYAINTGAFDTLQTSVNIADQQCIEQTIPLAVARGMGIIAKRPIANAAWTFKSKPENTYIQPYWERFQDLKYDFAANGDVNAAVEKALRFTLSVPGVNVAIVGTKRPGRWRENARLLEKGPLTTEEFDAIRNVWFERSKSDWVGQV
jgi:aryl-alcohol dehydrogenase-like predicted oxidoreductase